MLRVTVKKQDIQGPLAKVQTIVDKKTTMTIINNVYLYTENDQLFIEATDLEISYRTKIPCEVIQPGAITVQARKFYEIVKEFPAEEIRLEEDESNWLRLGAGDKVEYKIGGLPPDHFPKFRQLSTEQSFEIDASVLKDLIDKTIFSVSHDDSNFSLAGIYFEKEAGETAAHDRIRMVSSNGHRLSLMEQEVEAKPMDIPGGVIIPRKGAQEIRRLLEGREKVTVGIDENFFFLKGQDDDLVVRLIDGRFPDYRAIIPADRLRALSFDRQTVFNALKRISILSSDHTFRGVKASVHPDSMEIESLYKDTGDAHEVVDAIYKGEPFEIAFNAKYLMDALSVMKSEQVEFTVNSAESPCLITGNDDAGFLGLIMPMSLVREEKAEA